MDLGCRMLSGPAVMLPPDHGQDQHASVGTSSRSIVFEKSRQNPLDDFRIGIAEAAAISILLAPVLVLVISRLGR